MLSTKNSAGAGFAALVLGISTLSFGNAAQAAPLGTAASTMQDQNGVINVRRGGFGLYIGPSYGYDYGYRDYYDDDYYYDYPRRYRSYDYYYDRPYRKHSRRWVRERFQHPLGRR